MVKLAKSSQQSPNIGLFSTRSISLPPLNSAFYNVLSHWLNVNKFVFLVVVAGAVIIVCPSVAHVMSKSVLNSPHSPLKSYESGLYCLCLYEHINLLNFNQKCPLRSLHSKISVMNVAKTFQTTTKQFQILLNHMIEYRDNYPTPSMNVPY